MVSVALIKFVNSIGRIHGCYCNYVEDSIETNTVKTPKEFWDFATTVHESLFKKMNSDQLVKMMKYCGQFGDMYGMFATLGSIRTVRNDYAIAVHENVDLLIDDRDQIEVRPFQMFIDHFFVSFLYSEQIQNVCSSVASHNMGSPFHHSVHVFREKIYYYIYHYPNYATIDKTKEFARKTLDVLKVNCA